MSRHPSTILMTTDAVGGVWTYAMELCRALPSIHFVVANMGPRPSEFQRGEVEELRNVRLEVGDFDLEWMHDPWSDLERASEWLVSLEEKYSPELIHLNGYVHGSCPWQAPVLVVGHSCVLSWWMAVKKEQVPPSWRRFAAAVAKGLLAADQVVVPSQAMGVALKTHYELPITPLVIANGCSSRGLRPCEPKKPVILCAARLWDEAKNVVSLAKAVRELPWPLVLAGDAGDDGIALPNVKQVGFCDRLTMCSWFRRASVYAHPARYEPFGLAPLEAAHARCALVLADIPSLREVWGESAVFVHPDDSTGWERSIMDLIEDPHFREEMASKAVVRAKRYTPQRMAESYLNSYRGLLRRQPTEVSQLS